MAGKMHRLFQRRSALIQEGDERMPQTMEIGEQRPIRSLDDVRDSGGLQVHPKHLRGFLRPSSWPYRTITRLVAKVAAKNGPPREGAGVERQYGRSLRCRRTR